MELLIDCPKKTVLFLYHLHTLFAKLVKTHCFLAGKLIGSQLQSVGINTDFAPVLDLFNKENPTLLSRTFSADPNIVFESGMAFAKGLLSENIIPVIKHFPGLGASSDDTHFNSTNIEFNETSLNKNLTPFIKALNENVPAIMISHAIHEYFDNKPASRSSKVVTFIKNLSSKSLLITDDIAMLGYGDKEKFVENTIESLNAGMDIIICSYKEEDQYKLLNSLEDNKSKISQNINTECIKRVTNYKDYFLNIKKRDKYNSILNHKKLANELAQRCITQHITIDNIKNKEILLITFDLSKIRPTEKRFIKKKKSYIFSALRQYKSKIKEIILNPLQKIDFKKVMLEKFDVILVQTFFSSNSYANQNQASLLQKLNSIDKEIIILSLGHPFEQNVFKQKENIIEISSFHKPILDVVWNRLITNHTKIGIDNFFNKQNR